ncbi:Two-component response regulator SSK1p [Tilletia horrida]|uniref:Two-component response regulator SSK1p n=1 Tax=Tilletia horrida TaxID=155126 RepID=A0AAN6GHA6_9BASI|nr:Two-component response regulator SSK1p [Tilletia horrida]
MEAGTPSAEGTPTGSSGSLTAGAAPPSGDAPALQSDGPVVDPARSPAPSSLESQSGSIIDSIAPSDVQSAAATTASAAAAAEAHSTPTSASSSISATSVLRSPHSIASAPSALHRIAEVPDTHPQPAVPPSPSVPGSDPGQQPPSDSALFVPGSNQLGISSLSGGPVLTSTPTGDLSAGSEGFLAGTTAAAATAAATAAASASRRRPFQRTLSMPLGAKLGQLQKPRRSSQRVPTAKRAASSTSIPPPSQGADGEQSGSSASPTAYPATPEERQLSQQADGEPNIGDDGLHAQEAAHSALTPGQDGSLETEEDAEENAPFPSLLADTLHLSISTLLQLISPHLLDPSHERYSASSIQVPVTSIEALLESHRALNWLCAKMDDYAPSPSGEPPKASNKALPQQEALEHVAEAASSDSQEEVILVGAEQPATAAADTDAAQEIGSEADVPSSESQASASIATPSQGPSSLSSFSRIDPSGPSTAASSLQLAQQGTPRSRTNSALLAAARQISARVAPPASTSAQSSSPIQQDVDFDIAELVQRAADAVSGQAAARGVEVALCPPTFRLLHKDDAAADSLARMLGISVHGDEGAVRFGMLHALSKIVDQCERGETVHAALCVTELEKWTASGSTEERADEGNGKGKAREAGGIMHCCLHIYRKKTEGAADAATATATEDDAAPAADDATLTEQTAGPSSSAPGLRPRPLGRALSTKFLQSICCNVTVRDVPWPAVLKDHGRSMTDTEAPTTEPETTGNDASFNAHQYTLHYYLQRGGPLLEAAAVDLRESFSRQRYLPSISVGREPSLAELVAFVDTELKAKARTVALHAHADSTGAKQLISMLSSWGCSVALFPLPRLVKDGISLGSDGMAEPLPPGEDTGLWAGVPHDLASSMDISGGAANNPDASVGSEVDSFGIPVRGPAQRLLRTAVALVPDGKPSLVSYPSGLQLPLLPPSSSGDGVRRSRGSMDTVIGVEGDGLPLPTATTSLGPSAPIDAAVLDPVTGVPLAVTATSQGEGPENADKVSGEEALTAGLSSQIVPFSFVIIDDDVEVLQRELLRLQSAVPMLRSAMGSPIQTPGVSTQWDPLSPRTGPPKPSQFKPRPTLPHRGTSNLQIQRVIAEERGESFVKPAQRQVPGAAPMQKVPSAADSPTYAIVHLTSLGNFRLVRDFVRSMIESTTAQQRAGVPLSLPEILVIPKPIGPRRLLTTLHTAVHKPLVDEFFVPIATSPLNPGMSSVPGSSIAFNDVFGREGRFKPSKFAEPDAAPVPVGEATLHEKNAAASALAAAPTREFSLVPPAPIKTGTPSKLATRPADSGQGAEQPDAAKLEASTSGEPAKSRPDGSLPIPSPSPGAHTPWSGSSAPGKRSHPSSPLPMDALEYFNETASRMGSRAASGMLVQSADGKSAGIFFRPGDHGRSQSGSSYHRHGSTDNADSDRGSIAGHTAASVRWPPPSSQRGEMQLGNMRRKSSTTTAADVDSESSTSSRRVRSPSTGQQGGPRPFPSGSLFSPEVGIEAVLAGSAPPVATPLGPANRNGVTPNLWDPASMPSRPGPAAVIAASGTPSGRSPQQSSAVSPPEPAVPPPPSPGESPVPKQLELPAESTGVVSPSQRIGANGGLADIPEHQPHARSPNELLQPRSQHQQRSVAMTPQQSTRGAKPSALPQPGLLIGAGFAAKGKKVAAPKKALVREPVLPPIKVLIVEDNPINQRIMAKFMDKKKIKYEIATNGRDAIERWQSGGFHLILMDIQLPVMDGIEATREIRRLERSANIGILPSTPPAQTSGRDGDTPSFSPARAPLSPFRASVIIVALTASVFHPDRVAALAAGCNDYLTKPVNHNWLEKKIIEWGSMQYILLSGFPSDNWDRWREERRIDAASVAAGPGASRQLARDIRRGFNSVPDENARRLASKLHISRAPRTGNSPGPPIQTHTVPGRVTSDHPHQAIRPAPDPLSRVAGGGGANLGQASTDSTSSSGSSIRIDTSAQQGQLDQLDRVGSSGDVPTLSSTDASAAGAVPAPAAATASLIDAASARADASAATDDTGPAAPGAMLAVAPLQPSVPTPVSDEDVERLIDEHQVTKEVPGDSAVRDLAD